MAIDSSIYSNIKQPEVQNPLNALASYAQVQNAMNENALMPLKMQHLQLDNEKGQQQFGMIKSALAKIEARKNGQNALADSGQSGGNALTGTNPLGIPTGDGIDYSLEDLGDLAKAGYEPAKQMLEVKKVAMQGQKFDPGATYKIGNNVFTVPKIDDGTRMNPAGRVEEIPGYSQTHSAIAGAQAQATEGAKLLPMDYRDQGGRPIGGTVGGYLSGQQTTPQQAPAQQGSNISLNQFLSNAKAKLNSPVPDMAPNSTPGMDGLDLTKLPPQVSAYLAKQDPRAFSAGVMDTQNSGYTPPANAPDGTPVPPQVQQQLSAIAQSRDPNKLQQFSSAVMSKLSQMPDSQQKQSAMQGLTSEMTKIQQSWQQGAQPSPQQAQQQGGLPQLQSASEAQQEKANIERQNAPGLTYATGAGKNMADYEKGLNDRVSTGSDLMMNIEESRNALQKFQAGGGTETRVGLAKAAQAIGAPTKLVDSIAGGDLSAAQEFQKLSAQQAMENLKKAIGGSGRITQAEFKVFQQNNPNLDTDPRAIEKIYNFGTKVFQRDKSEQDAFSNYKKVPGADITQFPNYWASQLQSQGIVNPQQVTGKAKGVSALPSLSVKTAADYARIPSGATYTAPDGTVRRKP